MKALGQRRAARADAQREPPARAALQTRGGEAIVAGVRPHAETTPVPSSTREVRSASSASRIKASWVHPSATATRASPLIGLFAEAHDHVGPGLERCEADADHAATILPGLTLPALIKVPRYPTANTHARCTSST